MFSSRFQDRRPRILALPYGQIMTKVWLVKKVDNTSIQHIQISRLRAGDEFNVEEICGEQGVLARLNEIGIRKGMRMVYFSQAPFGGPLIFRLGATMFALRQEEFRCLILQKI